MKQYLNTFAIRPQGSGVSFHNPNLEARNSEAIENPVAEVQNCEPTNTTQETKAADIPKTEDLKKMSETENVTSPPENVDEEDNVETKEAPVSTRKSYKYDDPPIVFKDIDVIILCFVSIFTNLMCLSIRDLLH